MTGVQTCALPILEEITLKFTRDALRDVYVALYTGQSLASGDQLDAVKKGLTALKEAGVVHG